MIMFFIDNPHLISHAGSKLNWRWCVMDMAVAMIGPATKKNWAQLTTKSHVIDS